MKEVKDRVRQLVIEALDSAGLDVSVSDESSLIDSGLLDSFTTVALVQGVQTEFDIALDFADVTVENFDSIALLARMVCSRLDTET